MGLEVKEITKFFGNIKVLNSISLDVEKGEFLVILGPSGSGKTTLLRIISGLEKANEGKVIIDGNDVTELPPGRRDIAMVFQNYALFPHKTVRENLFMAIENIYRKEEAEDLIREVSSNLGILNLLSRYPSELSGGQQQRVALARALVKRPRLFLMDEPLSNLDAPQRISARKLIKDIQRENSVTTVYVTHDQIEAMTLADKIAIIDKGDLIQFGTPEEIYSNPVNEFVATFFGNPPMAVIDGKITGIEGKVAVRAEDVEIGKGDTKGVIDDVEFWGDRYLVYIRVEDNELRGFSPLKLKVGQDINFTIRNAKRL
ncbi:sugar ABC transporter ATP-binding protein [Candidatus Acidianus copahuensis]|uniref:Sugar ABC transporter ATP-binding protein n=1 Tax=Candidatus Acidianus copahuensis TaxID=1160895 RepID=A0A031LL92_9CREN|nr:ABC transporter ATP-binding protein [Candidatus Acidianus copahuensis]EZQ02267.1 sugar ABC transporter ATP-binding protein [Candidatus Acidianus copahuensis]